MADQTKKTQRTADEANGHAQTISEDSIEYKLLQGYTQRKNPKTPVPSDKQKKKRFKFQKFLRCIQPAKEDDGPTIENNGRRPALDTSGPEQEVDDIVNRLTEIADSVHLLGSEIETDSNDDIERIVEILREQGDKLNEEIEKNHILMEMLQSTLTYNYFKKITTAYLRRLSPEELPPKRQPKQARIALVCEVTRRLKIMDRHPMNRVLGFGAKYLQEFYSQWAKAQGGYGKVFSTDDDDEEEVQ
ncbi:apoptosis facilitator Bcl-2-like protein 14 [Pygocentrus nattereri]|uniref:Apoptosis facilitator Bcl-2-like protein 14 n=1 Tax=Pygocentrus nattereri TaxID=42514 RepID=A0AAR2IIR7_PYGNA|nr:apoptosis facilitator Bcl-2-like protein 14 [Pygocentrus nattereri]